MGAINPVSCIQSYPSSIPPISSNIAIPSSSFLKGTHTKTIRFCTKFNAKNGSKRRKLMVKSMIGVVDPWAPNVDTQSIASQLFALSLFPYLGFLYFITNSKSAPKLTLFGYYFLLAFVGATIPAGIYAKVHYGTSLSNVDWLHGGAESLLTLSNLFVVLGLRKALKEFGDSEDNKPKGVKRSKEENPL